MDKIWYAERIKECKSVKPEIVRLLKEEFKISDKDFDYIMYDIESQYHSTPDTLLRMAILNKCAKRGYDYEEYEHYLDLMRSSGIEKLFNQYTKKNILHEYLDSDPMIFNGDILITDPCYIIRAKHHGTIPITKDDWNTCNYGYNMKKLGINHYMTRDTLYGDWSCTTFDSGTKEPIGSFCADAGLVSVFLLDEVLKYNPDYDWYITKPYTATVIKNFKGTVRFVVKYQDGYYEDETEYHRKGEHWEDYYLEVIGHGINKVTGETINFVGKQSGF